CHDPYLTYCPTLRSSDLPAIAAAADLFVLPSIKREGLARSLIEAMILGTPPIVTDCGGSPELVVHEESGLVVPVRDSAALAAARSEEHTSELQSRDNRVF